VVDACAVCRPAARLARRTARDHLCEGIGRHHGRGEGDRRLDEHDAVLLGQALRHVLERERDQSIVQPAARLQQVRVPLVELDVAHPRDRRVLRAIDLDHGRLDPWQARALALTVRAVLAEVRDT